MAQCEQEECIDIISTDEDEDDLTSTPLVRSASYKTKSANSLATTKKAPTASSAHSGPAASSVLGKKPANVIKPINSRPGFKKKYAKTQHTVGMKVEVLSYLDDLTGVGTQKRTLEHFNLPAYRDQGWGELKQSTLVRWNSAEGRKSIFKQFNESKSADRCRTRVVHYPALDEALIIRLDNMLEANVPVQGDTIRQVRDQYFHHCVWLTYRYPTGPSLWKLWRRLRSPRPTNSHCRTVGWHH